MTVRRRGYIINATDISLVPRGIGMSAASLRVEMGNSRRSSTKKGTAAEVSLLLIKGGRLFD
ncbi:MAG: hypothetical protein OEZ00_04540 [Dehalococcoidia bacterium]|nr:hypothetical protein [Dehalococcoidia bacterium]